MRFTKTQHFEKLFPAGSRGSDYIALAPKQTLRPASAVVMCETYTTETTTVLIARSLAMSVRWTRWKADVATVRVFGTCSWRRSREVRWAVNNIVIRMFHTLASFSRRPEEPRLDCHIYLGRQCQTWIGCAMGHQDQFSGSWVADGARSAYDAMWHGLALRTRLKYIRRRHRLM